MALNRILIVDDERALRFALRDFLETSGYSVIEAEDLRGARIAVADEEPDLVLLDYRLPDGESSRLIPDLKAFNPDLPIVVLTGARPRGITAMATCASSRPGNVRSP